MSYSASKAQGVTKFSTGTTEQHTKGRWPANVIHDGSDEVLAEFAKYGESKSSQMQFLERKRKGFMLSGSENNLQKANSPDQYGDTGTAARFFYTAKASRSERGEGNTHATVKPLSLIQYLCRLITPRGGTVIDPFMGSGTTGYVALGMQYNFIGIEKEADHYEIARRRLKDAFPLLMQEF